MNRGWSWFWSWSSWYIQRYPNFTDPTNDEAEEAVKWKVRMLIMPNKTLRGT